MYIPQSDKGSKMAWSPADNGKAHVFKLMRHDTRAIPPSNIDLGVSIESWFQQYAPGQSSIKAVCRVSGIAESGFRVFPTITPILPIQVFQAFGIDSPHTGLMIFVNRMTKALESRRYPIDPCAFRHMTDDMIGVGALDALTVMVDAVDYLIKNGMSADDIIAASKAPAVGPGDTCVFGPKTILGDVLDPNSFAGKTYFIDVQWSNRESQIASVPDVVKLYKDGRFDPSITMTEFDDGTVVFKKERRV